MVSRIIYSSRSLQIRGDFWDLTTPRSPSRVVLASVLVPLRVWLWAFHLPDFPLRIWKVHNQTRNGAKTEAKTIEIHGKFRRKHFFRFVVSRESISNTRGRVTLVNQFPVGSEMSRSKNPRKSYLFCPDLCDWMSPTSFWDSVGNKFARARTGSPANRDTEPTLSFVRP